MVLATALWGATFVVIRDSLDHLDPASLVFGRFATAGVALATVTVILRRRFSRAAVEGGAVTGLLTAAGYLFQAIGLTATSAGSSAFLTCAGTVFAGLFAWPILRQRPQRELVGGIVLAIAGAALLTITDQLRLGTGEMWTLLGAFSYALQIVFVARYVARADPIALVAVQSLTVAAVLLPMAVGAPGQFLALDVVGWARFAYLALAGSLVAPLLQVASQRVLAPGRVGLLFALEPVFALLFAVTLGGERFVGRWWLGAVLILGGLLLVEWPAALRRASQSSAAGASA